MLWCVVVLVFCYVALLRLVVRGALLRFVERCSGSRSVAPVVFRIVRRPESRAQCHCLHSILRAPVCARLAPDHCLMHRGQTPPASHQRCGSGRRLWLQMKGEQSNCPAEQPGLRRVVRPKEAPVLVLWAGAPDPVGCAVDRDYLSFIR